MANMTKTELKANWEKVLSILETKIEKLKVDTFFRPLTPVKLKEKDAVIVFECQSGEALFRTRLRSYQKELSEAVFEVFGVNYDVNVFDKAPVEEEESFILDEDRHPNPTYTFESFVQGSSNNLALAACLAVADGYFKEYNPLFLYGGSGLGKTHLMHAIWQYVLKNKPRKKVLYVSSETFTNELIQAIQHKTQHQFRNKYRNVDYLLFDDVQFIAGRASTEEELFNTFDALYSAGKQIVFSSDRAPKDLGDIPERLLSRFQQGMIADIQQPDYETRFAILKNKAILSDIPLDEGVLGVLDVIASSIEGNIRELEGAFTRVIAHSKLTSSELDRDFAKQVLSEVFNTKTKEITPALIKKTVANYFGIKVSEIESERRSRNIAFPRQIAIYLIRENTNYSLPSIGEYFGNRDHTTILHSYEKIKAEVENSADTRNTVENIQRLLRE